MEASDEGAALVGEIYALDPPISAVPETPVSTCNGSSTPVRSYSRGCCSLLGQWATATAAKASC